MKYSFYQKKDHTQKMHERMNFEKLNLRVIPLSLQVLRQLLPNGTVQNQEYVALNPTRKDKHLGSFRINTISGKWADFATGDKGGDIISLWAYIKGVRQIDAARKLQAITGGLQ